MQRRLFISGFCHARRCATIGRGAWFIPRCLGVACGVQSIAFFGRSVFGGDAWLGSGYIFCIGTGRFWTNCTYFLRCRGLESCGVVSVLTQNGEVCSADASVFCPARDARTWTSGQ